MVAVSSAAAVMMMSLLGGMFNTICEDKQMRCDNPKGTDVFWSIVTQETRDNLAPLLKAVEPMIPKCKTELFRECRDAACGKKSKPGCGEDKCAFFKDGCKFLRLMVASAKRLGANPKPMPYTKPTWETTPTPPQSG